MRRNASEPVPNPSSSTFWELHRKLGEIYAADVAQFTAASSSLPLGSPASGPNGLPLHRGLPSTSPVLPGLGVPVRTLLDDSEGEGKGQENSEELDLDSVPNLDFKPYACFKETVKDKKGSQRRTVSMERAMDVLGQTSAERKEGRRNCFQRHRDVLHPGGHFRTGWNLAVAFCVLHDLIFVPLEAFELPPSVPLRVMEWATQLFWNFDFLVSCRTGYYKHGALVLDPWESFKQYARTWMPFDVLLICLDWAIVWVSAADAGLAQWSRTLTMLRFLRLARMLRWVKLQRVNEVFQELLHSQAASLYYSLFGSIARLLVLNHLVSCAWYGVGRLGGADGWLQQRADSGIWQSYLECLNWAFAQLSVGSSDILPANTLELAFCCIIAFRSLITYSTLISTMTSLMSGLSRIKEDEATEFRLLRNYLVHNDIPKGLQQKIVRFLQNQYALRKQAKSVGSRVPLLELLSQQLTGELHIERYRQDLCKVSFLRNLLQKDDFQVIQVLQKVALTAVSDVMVAAHDVVFLGGSIAAAAYLKVSGALTYYHASMKDSIDRTTWLAEACLWTNWIYMGDLVAEDVSHLTVIDSNSFCELICDSISTQRAAAEHARHFLKVLQRQETLSDIFREEGCVARRPSRLSSTNALKVQRWCCFSSRRVEPAEFNSISGTSAPAGS
ncbi:unnamed protein product [Durusdinium trenchii]|uniref:Ion transport domain-containing protein n=2 Tax=Durusdinium trenchii TaxID=1381693 RepID=A0ABP0ILG6_9DINO